MFLKEFGQNPFGLRCSWRFNVYAGDFVAQMYSVVRCVAKVIGHKLIKISFSQIYLTYFRNTSLDIHAKIWTFSDSSAAYCRSIFEEFALGINGKILRLFSHLFAWILN
jgi:hypothetical protein